MNPREVAESVSAEPRAYTYPRISPDGTRVALDVRDQDEDIWIWDFTRKTLTRFTFSAERKLYPTWTPDGTRIAYNLAWREILWKAADGSGVAEQIYGSDAFPYFFSPTDTELVFRSASYDLGR